MNRTYPTRVICCVCGAHIRWIESVVGGSVSHGYCKKHFEEAIREADEAFRHDEALHQ